MGYLINFCLLSAVAFYCYDRGYKMGVKDTKVQLYKIIDNQERDMIETVDRIVENRLATENAKRFMDEMVAKHKDMGPK